jgi:hypothetical protein
MFHVVCETMFGDVSTAGTSCFWNRHQVRQLVWRTTACCWLENELHLAQHCCAVHTIAPSLRDHLSVQLNLLQMLRGTGFSWEPAALRKIVACVQPAVSMTPAVSVPPTAELELASCEKPAASVQPAV